MAARPAWSVNNNGRVVEKIFSFEWNGGFAVSQKKKNIAGLHASMTENGCGNILEVSSKSDDPLGAALSAFNLRLDGHYLENVFQSSKVYELGGPYADLLECPPKDAKRDGRHVSSGRLTGFLYNGAMWELKPETAFYDYIYVTAAVNTVERAVLNGIRGYDWFTDIEFNPKKSINCQARSAAALKYLIETDLLYVTESIPIWLNFHRKVLQGGIDD
jgi:alpha-ketoglutarate-dependent taurine dioxygenase